MKNIRVGLLLLSVLLLLCLTIVACTDKGNTTVPTDTADGVETTVADSEATEADSTEETTEEVTTEPETVVQTIFDGT